MVECANKESGSNVYIVTITTSLSPSLHWIGSPCSIYSMCRYLMRCSHTASCLSDGWTDCMISAHVDVPASTASIAEYSDALGELTSQLKLSKVDGIPTAAGPHRWVWYPWYLTLTRYWRSTDTILKLYWHCTNTILRLYWDCTKLIIAANLWISRLWRKWV